MTISVPPIWRLTPLLAVCLAGCQSTPKGGLTPPPPPGVPASVSISPQSATFASVDETRGFSAVVLDADQQVLPGVAVTWSSTNGAVVTVDATGSARARGNGSANITATAASVSGNATATVQQVATTLTVSPGAVSIPSGSSTTLSATLNDANGHPVAGASVIWASGDPGIATVDNAGRVSGIAPGSATLTATSGALSAMATVIVTGGTGRTIFFQEAFEDSNFGARGWYDDAGVQITTSESHSGSSALAFRFPVGATAPTGRGMRHQFPETAAFHVSYWIKYSANWVGSGDPYHPHEFLFMTNEEGQYAAPAASHLTVYVEHVYQNGGIPRLAGQDALNIDLSRIGQDLTGVTENRSTMGCNGTLGQSTGTSCFAFGGGYRNDRTWDADRPYFTATPGAGYKNAWHFVEAYFQLNSIQSGVGINDGVLQYWFDGQLIIDYQDVLLRTGAHPTMAFDQMLMAPWIGSGSPVDQTMWIDDLTVATTR